MNQSEQLCPEVGERAVRIGQERRWPSLWATMEPSALGGGWQAFTPAPATPDKEPSTP